MSLYDKSDPGICNTCRFWSENVAKAEGDILETRIGNLISKRGKDITAMCLNAESPHSFKMTGKFVSCDRHKAGASIDARKSEASHEAQYLQAGA